MFQKVICTPIVSHFNFIHFYIADGCSYGGDKVVNIEVEKLFFDLFVEAIDEHIQINHC